MIGTSSQALPYTLVLSEQGVPFVKSILRGVLPFRIDATVAFTGPGLCFGFTLIDMQRIEERVCSAYSSSNAGTDARESVGVIDGKRGLRLLQLD